jgi:hypothetical protein
MASDMTLGYSRNQVSISIQRLKALQTQAIKESIGYIIIENCLRKEPKRIP